MISPPKLRFAPYDQPLATAIEQGDMGRVLKHLNEKPNVYLREPFLVIEAYDPPRSPPELPNTRVSIICWALAHHQDPNDAFPEQLFNQRNILVKFWPEPYNTNNIEHLLELNAMLSKLYQLSPAAFALFLNRPKLAAQMAVTKGGDLTVTADGNPGTIALENLALLRQNAALPPLKPRDVTTFLREFTLFDNLLASDQLRNLLIGADLYELIDYPQLAEVYPQLRKLVDPPDRIGKKLATEFLRIQTTKQKSV